MRYLISLAVLVAMAAAAPALDERDIETLSCQPVNGYVQLPGIKYDDLTPLARELFRGNPAAVSNALYALPAAEREDFITLYLEPGARERHRYFFARCREAADRRTLASLIDDGDVLPAPLRQELRERETARLALHEGALPFRVGSRTLYIPVPAGYKPDDGPLALHLRDSGIAESRAVFGKTEHADPSDPDWLSRPILASVDDVREAGDNARTMLEAYRTMVDADWRLSGYSPPGAPLDLAESLEYKWNLRPFNVRDNSFCYGQLEKSQDLHGVNRVRYRATAVISLPGCSIQVSVFRTANTTLAQVDEMNADIGKWRDAILVANWRYIEGR